MPPAPHVQLGFGIFFYGRATFRSLSIPGLGSSQRWSSPSLARPFPRQDSSHDRDTTLAFTRSQIDWMALFLFFAWWAFLLGVHGVFIHMNNGALLSKPWGLRDRPSGYGAALPLYLLSGSSDFTTHSCHIQSARTTTPPSLTRAIGTTPGNDH